MATLANTELSNTFNKWRLDTNVTTDRVRSITHSTDNGRIVLTGNVEVNTSDFVVDTTTSRVGIGVAAPTKELDVSGEVKVSANLAVDTSVLYVDAVTDRVGILTTTPQKALDVNGTIDGTTLTDGTISITGGNITDAVGITATTFTGDLTGNADTADALSGAVTVTLTGDVTGTANFTNAGDTATITTTIEADSIVLGTDTTGDYVDNVTGGDGISVTGSAGEGWAPAVAIDATSLSTNDITKWNGSKFVDSSIADDGTTVTVVADMNISGHRAYNAPATVSDGGSTITVDFSAGNNFDLTFATGTGDRNFAAPTNLQHGQIGTIKVSKGASGGPTVVTFDSNWKFASDVPDLGADLPGANDYGFIDYYIDETSNSVRANWSGQYDTPGTT